jgi:uncharacterized protein YndB with AHSA1/START domain
MNSTASVASRDDYATLMQSDTVRLQRWLPGPIERVWGYLTDGALRRQWLAAGDMPLEVGATFELIWRNDELTDPPGRKPAGFGTEHLMQSRITELDPPRRIAFTWDGSGDVSFELSPGNGRVLLTVTHRRLRDRGMMLMVGAGWHMHLDVLVARFTGGSTEPFWDGWSRLKDEYDRRLPA